MITNRGIFAKLNFFIPNDDFLDIINKFDKEFFHSEELLDIKWMEDHKQFVSEILTPKGLCLTFNLAFANQVLNINSTSNDFHYQLIHLFYKTVPKDLFPPKSLPRKISSSFAGLYIKIDMLYMFFNELYEENPHGFTVFIHDPFELPSMNSKIYNINIGQRNKILIDAKLNTIDNSLIHLKPDK